MYIRSAYDTLCKVRGHLHDPILRKQVTCDFFVAICGSVLWLVIVTAYGFPRLSLMLPVTFFF